MFVLCGNSLSWKIRTEQNEQKSKHSFRKVEKTMISWEIVIRASHHNRLYYIKWKY